MPHSTRWSSSVAFLCALLFFLAACGGGGGSQSPAPTPPPLQPAPPPLISGSESALASAVLATTSDKPLAAADVSGNYLLSRLLVTLKTDATVGQVNAAARMVGATRITSSEPGSPLIVLEVPRQADVAAIQQLASTMRDQAGIAFAWPGESAESTVLPEASAGVPVGIETLSHLRGNRFPQAWNARQAIGADCLPHSVSVYVMDKFGPASARPNFFNEIEQSSFVADPNGTSATADGHGYDVASTLAANFNAATPTGANPFEDCVLVHAIEVKETEYADAVRRAAHLIAANPDPRVILTQSLAFNNTTFCGSKGDQLCDETNLATTPVAFRHGAISSRVHLTAEWVRLVHAHGLADKVLITQAAGNVHRLPNGFTEQNYLGFRSVELTSFPTLATHLHDLKALLTSAAFWQSATLPTLPNLAFSDSEADALIQSDPALDPDNSLDPANLLIVDSGSSAATPEEVKQSSFDYLGADVRAVGENIILTDIIVPGQPIQGTSFSTPLVAGLAAYLWNLSPTLAAKPTSATVDLLKRSSKTTTNSPTVPVIDAYAAVLRLDTAGTAAPPIRLGLVDVNGDGVFDALDLQKFATAYGLANPNTPTIPTARDFSRFDLNGDGFTGGIPIAAFDLDINVDSNGQPVINSTDAEIEGYQLSFNEAALSDLQILCYYAYSLMYQGSAQNEQQRTALLGPDHCVGARLTLPLPAQISAATNLDIKVEVPAAQGQFTPAPNVLVDLTPTCATVNPTSGRTNANGVVSTVVTPSAGCTSASVQAVARANPATPPLAVQVASTMIVGPTPTAFFGVSVGQDIVTGGDLHGDFITAAGGEIHFSFPVSDMAGFLSQVRDTLSGVSEIGFLQVSLKDPGLLLHLDLGGMAVSTLSVHPSCGSTIEVTVGELRPNLGGTTNTDGSVGASGCGTVRLTTGAMAFIDVRQTNNLNLTLSSPRVDGILIGEGITPIASSTFDLTVGSAKGFNIFGSSDSSVAIHGTANSLISIEGNQNLTLAAPLVSSDLDIGLIVNNTTFAGPALSQFQVGSMEILTLTNNVGFSNADARTFANAHTVRGTTTITNNRTP
jgi:hypothetical protein